MAAALQPGCWRRAGMSAALTGLDTGEIVRRLGRPLAGGDHALLAAIEAGGLAGHARRTRSDDGAPDADPEDS